MAPVDSMRAFCGLSRRWSIRALWSALFLQVSLSSLAAGPIDKTVVNWSLAGWGGGGFYYSALFHPTHDGVLFLGTNVSGLAKSIDHGQSFRMVNSGLVDYAVYSLAADVKNPKVVYAGTPGGLHKSSDGGETWALVPGTGKADLRITSERDVSVRSVAVDPSDSDVVYAASPGGTIYKSTTGTASWRAVYTRPAVTRESPGLPVQFGKINGAYFGGIWVALAAPVAARPVTGFGLTLRGDGSRPERVYLTLRTVHGQSYRSRNIRELFQDIGLRDVVFGAADFELDPDFARRSPGLAALAPAKPDWTQVDRMDLVRVSAPSESSELVLTRAFLTLGGSTMSSDDLQLQVFNSGKTAVQVYGNAQIGFQQNVGATASSVVVCAQRPARVLAATSDGLLLSDDRGATWSTLPSPPGALHAACDAANADVIYGAFGLGGVHKSTDAGRSWRRVSPALSAGFAVREVVVSPTRPADVFAIGTDGWKGSFIASGDGGETWNQVHNLRTDPSANPTTPLDSRTPRFSTLTNLTLNPMNPTQLFVSANWRPAFSGDGGRTWEERVRGADITVHTDIRFSGARVYVSSMDEGSFVSDDQGKSWRQLWPLKYSAELSGHHWRLAVNNIDGVDRIIATVSPWTGKDRQLVAISQDGGKTFKTTTTGLPTTELKTNTMWDRGYPRALAVDPGNPQIVYLGIDGDPSPGKPGGGVFKSVDGGFTWAALPSQPGSRRVYYGLAVDPTDTKRLVWGACGNGGGVYITDDGGLSWRRSLADDTWIFNVHVTNDGTIYAGGANLWRSSDRGKTWTRLTQLSGRAVVGIEVNPRDGRMLWISAVTWGGGSEGSVLKSADSGDTWADITGNLQFRKPQILRFESKEGKLWSGQNVLQTLQQ